MADTENATTITPTSASQRIHFVDALRGFAILGILLVNISGFAGYSLFPDAGIGPVNRAVVALTQLLVVAKFYSLFSFLFGWGMAVQMERLAERTGAFLPLTLRRLFVLLLIGLLHAILLWSGDILALYALLGFLLVFFRRRSPRSLLLVIVGALLFSLLWNAPVAPMESVRQSYRDFWSFTQNISSQSAEVYSEGGYWAVTERRLQAVAGRLPGHIGSAGNIFAMFLLGLYAGKRRLFQTIETRLPWLRRVALVTLVAGLALNAVAVWLMIRPDLFQSTNQYWRRVAQTLGAPALMLFYVSTIILLWQRPPWQERLAPLAPVGRMALTNYLLQSVVGTFVFYGYGLGLINRIGPTTGFLLSLGFFLLQVRFSHWWLARFRFGPAEWLWRTLTYGRRQPWRPGQTAADLRPLPLVASLGRRLRRLPPALPLVATWIVLVLWVAGLLSWYRALEAPPATAAVAVATATPAAGESPAATATPTPFATPAVEPVAFEPGPVAASGDTMALAQAMSLERMQGEIEVLAGPDFAGRLAGSPGGQAAGDYLAAQFEAAGLRPAGDDGTFFQTFPITYPVLAEIPALAITTPGGTTSAGYELYEDYGPLVIGYAGAGHGRGQLVWAGDCSPESYNGLDTLGKVVLCAPGAGRQAFVSSSRHALANGAAGLLLLTDPEEWPAAFGYRLQETWVPAPLPAFRVYPQMVPDLLAGSDYVLDDLLNASGSFPLAAGAALTVTTTPASAYQARNVLGVIPGRDPAVAGEVVIIGAHYDHMGQGPEGTTWFGANDNASGTALLLEIARTWQEQGFVPRRTVLFAAWDAEEWGLVGSRTYVQNPRYPLTATIANVNADMIGSGADSLSANGSLSAQMRALADLLDIENRQIDAAGSDHTSFEQAGIPAGIVIWMEEGEDTANYHLPTDTPDNIEPQKLETAATIAHLTLLDLAENRPAVDQMLARRAEAVLAGDLDAFLATTAPAHVNVDRAWFADVQRWNPAEVELSTDGVHFAGDRAVADIHLKLRAAEEAGGELYFADWEVALRREGSAWQWAGANLQQVKAPSAAGPAMTVAAPPSTAEDLSGLGEAAATRYAGIAGALGLPASAGAGAELFLYPGESALRADTGPSLPSGQKVVVSPGTVRIASTGDISGTDQLENALVQLVLADAGVERADAPWLWEGLAPALRAGRGEAAGRAAVYEQFLPRLTSALEDEDPPLTDATAWGAVEYLREQIGWEGIGRFITDLGSSGDSDLALARALDTDAAGFAAAWESTWRSRLQTAQSDLEALLATRAAALQAGREEEFLRTVDPDVPGLLAAQQHLFRTISPYAVETYSTTVSPRVFLPDGDLLARYSLSYQLDDGQTQAEGRQQYTVFFSRTGDGFRWAGLPLETVAGDKITVRYPAGQEADARAILAEAQPLYTSLATVLGIDEPAPVVLELFDDREQMAATISPVFAQAAWRPSWSVPGTASKFPPHTPAEGTAGRRAVLANELTRQLLYQLGLGADPAGQWLVDGVAAYLPWSLAPGTPQPVMGHLQALAGAARQDVLFDLNAPPPASTLSQSEFWLLQAQAWDSVHYLVEQHGQQVLLDLLEARAAGTGLDVALETVLGRSPESFAADWAESLARGHIRPEWVALAREFDESVALAHVEALTEPALAGRAAGSAGAESAATYIAGQFAAYGLEPAGNLSRTTYFQSFPLTTTTAVAAPSFSTITGTNTFTYRQHYLGVQATLAGTGAAAPVVGELVWAGPDAAPETDLAGKIMLAELGENSVANLAGRAERYGAAALVLLGKRQEDADLLGKKPLLPQDTGNIPVIELTLSGSSYLMQELGLAWNTLAGLPPVRHFGVTARIHFAAQVESTTSANVLGLLPGSDPDLRDELLIVGAHYDHVGDDPASYLCPEDPEEPPSAGQCEVVPGRDYSGANDDASGVATLLEIARLWQESGYRPRRSVLFAAWGAQELGQLGSTYYTLSSTVPLTQTAGMLQLEGVAGGRGLNLGAQAEWTESGLWLAGIDQAWRLLDEKEIVITAPLDDSDHLPFEEQGLPTVLISWRLAGEDNLPDEIAYGVSEGRLATAGRITTLALLYLAR